MVEMGGVNKNDQDSINYNIKLLRGNTTVVNKDLLKSINMPDIG